MKKPRRRTLDVTDVLVSPIVVPSTMSERNHGNRIRRHAPRDESSLSRGVTDAVVQHCNLAGLDPKYLDAARRALCAAERASPGKSARDWLSRTVMNRQRQHQTRRRRPRGRLSTANRLVAILASNVSRL